MGRYCGFEGCWLGRGLLDRATDTIAARARSESLLQPSDVIAHMHMSHAPPPEPSRARNDLIGSGSVQG